MVLGTLNPDASTDLRGGNGTVAFTTDGKYAIKRDAGDSHHDDEVAKLKKIKSEIDSIGEIKGFKLNLPLSILEIPNKICNIQIFESVDTRDYGRTDRRDIAGVIRNYMRDGKKSDLKTIELVGKKLAQFQNPVGLKGLQHNDFNPGNILITRLEKDGDADFTLIDNARFRKDGNIMSDLAYFLYWTGNVLVQEKTAENISRLKEIVSRLYAGYVGALPAAVLKSMKENIFDKGGPLNAGLSRDSNVYKYISFVAKTWGEILEKAQKEAFYTAYNKRILDWSGKRTDDVSSLRHRKSLTSVNLSNTKVAAVEPLSKLENLTELDMSNTPVVWVGPLSKLKKLKKLNLRNTKINEIQSNLEQLSGLKNLKELNLERTGLSEGYIAYLKNEILPKGCKVIVGRP